MSIPNNNEENFFIGQGYDKKKYMEAENNETQINGNKFKSKSFLYKTHKDNLNNIHTDSRVGHPHSASTVLKKKYCVFSLCFF